MHAIRHRTRLPDLDRQSSPQMRKKLANAGEMGFRICSELLVHSISRATISPTMVDLSRDSQSPLNPLSSLLRNGKQAELKQKGSENLVTPDLLAQAPQIIRPYFSNHF